MTNPNIWNQILVWPILNVLIALYKFFTWAHIPGPLGFAIIGLTLIIRLLLYPLMQAQLRSARKMAKLKPHLDAINVKHKNDKQALQQAQLALYKEHGVNPAAGCLPLLIQMPVLIALYSVFYQVLNSGNLAKELAIINKVVYSPALRLKTLDLSFFGLNLAVKPSQWQHFGWWLLAIPLVTALLQWYQSKLMLAASPMMAPAGEASAETDAKKSPDAKALAVKEEKKPEDTAAEMQKQMAIITPIMFAYFAFQFPVGLALYWNVFGLFGIMQQLAINREK
ncbi:MAG TPA: YidC/Oxa1 family membrane protein insertase [Patescibacteria group bacterium]|nr:YidC/Oxa1 family membrane protein insertase [Patescibacteria group bacterium]